MCSCILILLLAGAPVQSPDELRDTVSAFWTHLAAADKASALKYVQEDCQNAFIMRRDPVIRSWSIVSVDHKEDGTAYVTVAVEGLFPGGPGILTVNQTQHWVASGNSWKLQVKPPTLAAAAKVATRKPPELIGFRVSPKQLRFHFLDSAQTAVVNVENGESSEAELLEVRYDVQRFEITKWPQKVDAGKIGRVVVRYKGTEEAKDLTSQISVRVRHGGKEEVFDIPVVYNYISEGARALFGLTPERARALRRGEKLTPVLRAPESGPRGKTISPPQPASPPTAADPQPN